MELRELRTFVAVAETGSFTRAGQRLRVSQSAVSQQIRALENSAGATLFSRQARKVSLTQAGNVLLPYARQILAKVDEATAVVSDYENLGRGRVVIGAGGAICHHVLPHLLKEFSERFARIEVQVISGFTSETAERISQGSVDVGIALLPTAAKGLATTEIGRDQLAAIAPAGHPWESLERVGAAELSEESLITYHRRSHSFAIIERYLLESGVFPKFGMEIGDLEAVKSMVEVGLGVSIVAGWAVRSEVEAGRLIAKPIGTNGLYRSWGVLTRAGETPTASLRGFVEICRTRFGQLLASPL